MRKRFKSRGKERLPAMDQDFRPADFPVASLQSRAAARALLLKSQRTNRMVVSCEDEPLNLETSTCNRQIWPDGSIFELVILDGAARDISEAQLEEFILRHPISGSAERNTLRSSKERIPDFSTQ
jgi:hypothetical protein